jgi:hypothetical protein
MKILRYLMLAVLALGMSNAAHAFSWTLNDPSLADEPSFFQIDPGVPFGFSFETCSVPLGGTTYKGCATGFNVSDQYLTSFVFTFADSSVLDGAGQISCSSDTFADISCNLVGDEFILSFDNCGSDPCGIAPGKAVTLLEDAVDGADFPDVDGIANTPEPSSIWLALSGMGSLGYLVRRRRRASNS